MITKSFTYILFIYIECKYVYAYGNSYITVLLKCKGENNAVRKISKKFQAITLQAIW